MNCIDARDALLVADPSELREGACSPLAFHLGACVACRGIADGLSRDLERLAVAVVQSASRRRRRTAIVVGLPIAASIVVAMGVFARREPVRSAPLAVSSRVVSVDVAHGQQAAVFTTTDPNVTVVWLSPGGDP